MEWADRWRCEVRMWIALGLCVVVMLLLASCYDTVTAQSPLVTPPASPIQEPEPTQVTLAATVVRMEARSWDWTGVVALCVAVWVLAGVALAAATFGRAPHEVSTDSSTSRDDGG